MIYCVQIFRDATDSHPKKQMLTPVINSICPHIFAHTYAHPFTHTIAPHSPQMDDAELAAEVNHQDFMDALLTVGRRLDGMHGWGVLHRSNSRKLAWNTNKHARVNIRQTKASQHSLRPNVCRSPRPFPHPKWRRTSDYESSLRAQTSVSDRNKAKSNSQLSFKWWLQNQNIMLDYNMNTNSMWCMITIFTPLGYSCNYHILKKMSVLLKTLEL